MRILIDLQAVQGDSRFRGIGRYSMSLALAMARNSRGHDIWLVLSAAFPQSIVDVQHAFKEFIPTEKIRVFSIPLPTAEVDPKNHWRTRAAECIREQFIQNLKPDIIHVPSLFEGYGDDVISSIGAYDKSSNTASTLYDLIPFMDQQAYLPDENIRSYYFRKIESLKNASALFAISESSKLEAINAIGISESKIINISAGAEDKFQVLENLTDETIIKFRQSHGITRKIILYTPGGFDSRKNFDGLMQAYALLSPNIRKKYQLVISSRLSKSVNDDSRAKLNFSRIQAGLAEDELILTDFIPDSQLIELYNMAELFVFPSKHEGFGLPPLEAMACGAATIASNISSLPEVIGWKDALFNPFSSASIAEKITQALEDNDFHHKLKQHGLKQVQKFTWDSCAHKAISGIEDLFKSNNDRFKITSTTSITNLVSSFAKIEADPLPNDNDLIQISNSFIFNNKNSEHQFFVDITELALRDAKSGIQRVVRSILLALLENTPKNFKLCPIYFDGVQYRHAAIFIQKLKIIESENIIDLRDEVIDINQDDIYLSLDLNPELTIKLESVYQYWKSIGVSVYFVVYDILLTSRPDWAPKQASENFVNWLKVITKVSTGLLCISNAVANEVRIWLNENPPNRLDIPEVNSFHLGADVENSIPTKGLPKNYNEIVSELKKTRTFLSVGTLEPRKGQMQTLLAFEKIWSLNIKMNLVLVGKQGWMVDHLVDRIKRHPQLGIQLFWIADASDEYLEKLYSSADCLIAASEGEGFGLPLIEAAIHRLPILARDLKVFKEVAGSHAFYFSGLDPEDLSNAIIEWARLFQLNLIPNITEMPFLTWKESASQLIQNISFQRLNLAM